MKRDWRWWVLHAIWAARLGAVAFIAVALVLKLLGIGT